MDDRSRGGSDVGATRTQCHKTKRRPLRLYGKKMVYSAVTSKWR